MKQCHRRKSGFIFFLALVGFITVAAGIAYALLKFLNHERDELDDEWDFDFDDDDDEGLFFEDEEDFEE